MRDLGDVSLPPDDFSAMATLRKHDQDFPPTLEAWRAMISEATLEAHRRGQYPAPMQIDVRKFSDWCSLVQVLPCLDSLRAFVIIRRREIP